MKEIKRNIFLPFFLSKNAGAISIIIALVFTAWSSTGEVWYRYILNFVIISVAIILIGTNSIQGLTRSFSYLYLYKYKGILKAIIMISGTIFFLFIAYFILRFVFDTLLQHFLFFSAYILLSTIIAITDKHFEMAIERTRLLESTLPHNKPEEVKWCKTCKYFKKIKDYEEKLFLSEEMINDFEIPCKILNKTKRLWINYFWTRKRERTLYPKNCQKWVKK